MINKQFVSDLTDKLGAILPDDMGEFKEDTKETICSVVQATFEKFDLVTREEFDVQAKVLARTREKTAGLERQVAELEKMIQAK
jgi:BMFP domain-containing protein YqiC